MEDFKESDFEEEELSYHVITTDNKFMAQLGLSTFTTGTLYQWFTSNGGKQAKFFENGLNPEQIFFSGLTLEVKPLDIFDTETSQYIENVVLPINEANWSYPCSVEGVQPYTAAEAVAIFNLFFSFGLVNLDAIDIMKSSPVSINGAGNFQTIGGGTIFNHTDDVKDKILEGSFTSLIEINNFVTKKLEESRGKIDDTWNRSEKLLAVLTSIIKGSKNKYLEWTMDVELFFNANLDQTQTSCKRTEKMTFRLYLFDSLAARNSRRTIGLPNSNTIGVPRSPTGQITGPEIVAPVDATYDKVTGKWSYGTELVMARVSETITGASKSATAEEILASKPGDFFNQFGKGKAIPIINKNGDPRVWEAEFTKKTGCTAEVDKPLELVVYNPSTTHIPKEDIVYLIKRSGRWFPIRVDVVKDEMIGGGNVGKWEFTYLSTSRDAYFRSAVRDTLFPSFSLKQFTTYEYEAMFRSWYYGTDGGIGVPSISVPSVGEYYQFTSFDFMDNQIGGLHPHGNTINQTNFKYDVTGGPLDPNGDGTEAAGTQQFPFCGCVFPDGYDTKGKVDYFTGGNGIQFIKKGDSDFVLGSNSVLKKPFDSSVKRNLNMLGNVGAVASETDMFTGSIAGSELLHLPADIALNASPSGTYGSPIVNTRIIPTINAISATILRKQVGQYLTNIEKNNYLLKSEGVSAFDLAPINSDIIQFRPLLFETFGAGNMADVAGYKGACPTKGLVVEKGRSRIENGDVILSDEFFIRNRGNNNNFAPQTYGYAGGSPLCSSLRYGRSTSGAWNMGVFAKGEWYNSPAQAVGVITASYTNKTASKRIQFDTTCFIGTTSTRQGSQSPVPTWGGPALINAFNTTCLFVRIFHSWPKEQTIFDPRFFAVFHFNDGIKEFNTDGTRKAILSPRYTNGVKDFPINTAPLAQQDYPAGKYNVDDMMPGGFRVPTAHDKTTASAGVLEIMSDSHLFRDKKHWNVDNREVGVLLPYTGKRLTIGLQSYFIKSGGFGYRVGDLFSVVGGSGTGSKWMVTAVTFGATAAGSGKITNIALIDPGRDYTPSDFISTADLTNVGALQPSEFKIKLVSDTLNKTALIYITQGQTSLVDNTISGPQEILKSTLISPLTPPEDEVVGKGIVSSPITVGVNLIASNKDPNNKYDIFFHFHNDISHTMAYGADFGSITPTYQQFIETSMSFI